MKKFFMAVICALLLVFMAVYLVSCKETPETPEGGSLTNPVQAPSEGSLTDPTDDPPETPEGGSLTNPVQAPSEGSLTDPTDDPPETQPDVSECTHNYEETSRIAALALKDGSIEYTCSKCGDSYSEAIPATKSVKILALGNSFTQDSTWHLWNICKDAGIENVVVGNLYIGNCTLNQHWDNIANTKPSYTFYKNTNGTWVESSKYSVASALKQEKWDYIVLHQTSGSAGEAESYHHLDEIIDFFNENKKNPDAKIIWHMPWAYQSDSTHSEFPKYDKDQMKMYQTITARVNELIIPKETISAIIPSGTAIQNLRTSYVGDNVTRDGYHLNYGFGRYTAALMWFSVITGGDVSSIDWIPDKYPDVATYLPAIKDAVKSAVEKPFEITPSAYSKDVVPIKPKENVPPTAKLDPKDYIEADTALAKAFGINLNVYEQLSWEYLENTYWNCTSKVGTTTPKSSSETYHQNICTKKKYSVANELPVGTVFICDTGWRFRMEIYPSEDAKYTGTRPEGCTAPIYVLSEDFLKGCTYIAWAVSSYPKTDISDIYAQAYAHVRVYIPLPAPGDTENINAAENDNISDIQLALCAHSDVVFFDDKKVFITKNM